MKMRFGYSVDRASLISRRICAVTGGDYAHCFVVFDESEGEPFYFESISKKVTHKSPAGVDVWKNGVRGPIVLDNLIEWSKEKPTVRMYEISDYIPVTDNEARQSYRRLCAACHDIEYATLQCANNWIESRLGIYIATNWFKTSQTHWNCSEALMRTCIPVRYWDYYNMINVNANRIVPDGDKMTSIRHCTQKLLDDIKKGKKK